MEPIVRYKLKNVLMEPIVRYKVTKCFNGTNCKI